MANSNEYFFSGRSGMMTALPIALNAAHMLGTGSPGVIHIGTNWESEVKRTTWPVRQV